MPKAFFYAAKVGRGGPQIYSTWAECESAVKGFPHARHKKFAYRQDAEMWLNTPSPPRGGIREVSNLDRLSSSEASTRSPTLASLTSSQTSASFSGPSSSFRASSSTTEVISLLDDSEDEDAAMGPLEAPVKRELEVIELLDDTDIESDLEGDLELISSTVLPPKDDAATAPKQLSVEQQDILDAVLSGESVFFTGSAGTGKSFLLTSIIGRLRSEGRRMAVTASTGIAAVNIGGCTLHSWAGIGLGKEDVNTLIKKLGQQSRKRWRDTETLIVDEISMVDGALLDKLDAMGKSVRGSPRPFGGIQLVLVGDFFQLPPVPEEMDNKKIAITFAFDAKCWEKAVPNCHTLTRVFRQKEQEFIDVLNEARVGKLKPAAIKLFQRLSRPLITTDGTEPTQLFSLRYQVKNANDRRLAALRTEARSFLAKDFPGYNNRFEPISQAEATKKLDRNVMAPAEITLKIGCQVMLIKNLDQGRLVNGSIGTIVDFQTPRQANETGHDIARVDDSPQEANSRQRARQRESLGGLDARELEACRWPLVKFEKGGPTLLIEPAEFSVMDAVGRPEAQRDQIPLILAWALSIHKSQGQTLRQVKVDLSTTFEKGQAYVALSRAMTLDGLQVTGFSPDKIMAHPRVIEWSRSLSGYEEVQSEDDDSEYWDACDDELIRSYEGPY